MTVEIYGLFDPDTGELRYIGKAKCSKSRFERHLSEAKHQKRPVHNWLRKLMDAGKLPRLEVLEAVPEDQWEAAEIRLIAKHRETSKLLNVAPGGTRPSQTKEQHANASRQAYLASVKDPLMARLWRAKRDMGRLYYRANKKPDFESYKLRFLMRCHAAERPDLFGSWASL